jgi:hypothetical protein
MKTKLEFIKTIEELSKRDGERPKTIGPAPHTQISHFPDNDDLSKQLFEFVMKFPDVKNGTSHIGDGGLSAFFISSKVNVKGFTEHFLIDNEFAHIHRHQSHSLHVVLPKEIGKLVEDKKWGEAHPLSKENRIPQTNYMLYGARDSEELEVQKDILTISYLFALNAW